MSLSSWLVAGIVPGVERQPLKKLEPDEDQLLKIMNRWRHEALQAGHAIERVVVAYEAGRDGFWLARWLRERGVEAYVMHSSSIAVSREHRRAKTDRLDTELLMRAFLGWLRGERRHCSMAAIPTIEEEDAKRPNREHEKLVGDRTRIVNRMKSTLARFGIRGFKPTLRKADEKHSELRTAEGTLLPENTCAELRRDMTRLRIVREQLKEIEQQRLRKLEAAAPAKKGPHAIVGHRHMGSSSDVQVPNRRLHRLQRRRADRRKKITEHLGGPRVFCATGPKAIPEEVKADVRIVASSVAVFAVSDFAFGGMHLQPALR